MTLNNRRASPLNHLPEFAISVRSQHPITRIVLRRSVTIVAVVGIFLSPVQYRGGATFVHSHSLLHLFADEADGSGHHPHELDHHRDHDHAAVPHGGVSSDQRRVLGHGSLLDGPRWMSAIPVGDPGVIFLLIAAVGAALPVRRALRLSAICRVLIGLVFPPEPPPPRGAAGSFLR